MEMGCMIDVKGCGVALEWKHDDSMLGVLDHENK
jgi:hypothetical protein